MGSYTIDRAAVAQVPNLPGCQRAMENLGEMIARDTRVNIMSMDPGGLFETGAMVGSVIASADQVRVDTEYAVFQHEGTSRGIPPHPFLSQAAHTWRGDIG